MRERARHGVQVESKADTAITLFAPNLETAEACGWSTKDFVVEVGGGIVTDYFQLTSAPTRNLVVVFKVSG